MNYKALIIFLLLSWSMNAQIAFRPVVVQTGLNDIEITALTGQDSRLVFVSLDTGTYYTVKDGIPTPVKDTGWAYIQDSNYTEGSPFELTPAMGTVTLPNDGDSLRIDQTPLDIDSMYNRTDTLIAGLDGDGIGITFILKIKPTQNTETIVRIGLDVGGPEIIFVEDYESAKGQNIEHAYMSTIAIFADADWQANGAKVKVSTNADVDIYDIAYVLTRTHRAN